MLTSRLVSRSAACRGALPAAAIAAGRTLVGISPSTSPWPKPHQHAVRFCDVSAPAYASGYSSRPQPGVTPDANADANGSNGSRTYTNYTIYKSKGALSIKLIPPTWSVGRTGAATLARKGTMMLEFANAVGNRSYNWDDKGTFGLSVLEMAQIVEDVQQGVEFFHDPNKLGQSEGQVTKTLRINVAPDGTNYFFNLTVTEREGRRMPYTINVTRAELGIMKTISTFAIPRLLGFDRAFDDMPMAAGGSPLY